MGRQGGGWKKTHLFFQSAKTAAAAAPHASAAVSHVSEHAFNTCDRKLGVRFSVGRHLFGCFGEWVWDFYFVW